MYKDIVISILGALLLEPVFKTTEVGEQIAMVIGLATVLFIFCLFCENQVEKWRKYRQRVRNLEQKLEQLRGGMTDESRESAGNYGETGADTVTALDDAG